MKGIEYFTLEKFSEAIASYSRALFLDQFDPSIYYHRAEACLGVLDFETAIRNYRKCLLLQKSQSNFVRLRLAFVLYTWGNVLLDCRRFQEAIECFDEALNLGVSEFECILKRYFGPIILRTFALTGLRDYENALTHLYALTEMKSDSADLYIFRAEVHKHLGNVEFTYLDMTKAKELNPDHPNLKAILEWIILICVDLKNKADQEILKSHYKEAIFLLNKAIDLDPQDWLLLFKR